MKAVWRILVIFLVLVLIASCGKKDSESKEPDNSEQAKESLVSQQDSGGTLSAGGVNPKEVLEKAFEKYVSLLGTSAEDVKSSEAVMSINYEGPPPPVGFLGQMQMDMKLALRIEMAFSKPHNAYYKATGDLGEIELVVSEKAKDIATIILPKVQKFGNMRLPGQVTDTIGKMEGSQEDMTGKLNELMEKLWGSVSVEHQGMEKLKIGTTHKMLIKPNKLPEGVKKLDVIAYIVDRKWDPARLEVDLTAEDMGESVTIKASLELEKLEMNPKISPDRFVPNVKGYTEVPEDEIKQLLLIQVISGLMPKNTSP